MAIAGERDFSVWLLLLQSLEFLIGDENPYQWLNIKTLTKAGAAAKILAGPSCFWCMLVINVKVGFVWRQLAVVGRSQKFASYRCGWGELSCSMSAMTIHSVVTMDRTPNLPTERQRLFFWAISATTVMSILSSGTSSGKALDLNFVFWGGFSCRGSWK